MLEQLREYHRLNGAHFPVAHFVNHIGYSKSSISLWRSSARLAMIANLPECFAKRRLRSVVLADGSETRDQQDQLYKLFLYRRRAKGLEVDYEWLRTEMKLIMENDKPDGYTKFTYQSNGWIEKFLAYYQISHQCQTEKKPVNNALRVPLLQSFHTELCLLQQEMGLNPRCPTFGKFAAKNIYNPDQIPGSFMKDRKKSLNPIGESCWILNQGPSGISKRIMTIVLTLRGEGEQIVPPFIIFRGMDWMLRCLLSLMMKEYRMPSMTMRGRLRSFACNI